MKRIVLDRTPTPRAGRPVLRPGPNGTVTLQKPGPTAPSMAIRCLGCAHLHSEEAKLGFKRASCSRGQFRSASGALRCFSLHELQHPSREVLATANCCPDYQPHHSEVNPWL